MGFDCATPQAIGDAITAKHGNIGDCKQAIVVDLRRKPVPFFKSITG
jgi:hypothetical protein